MEITDIEQFLPYYQRVRERTRRLMDLIPEDSLEWRPADGRFSLGDLARHIAGGERWMWVENVHGRPSRYPGHGPELAAGLPAVLEYVDRLHDESIAMLAQLTPEDLRAKSPTVGGGELRTWKWLRALVEHEIHHRGQIYMLLADLGVDTPPLFGLTEREVFARSLDLTESAAGEGEGES